MSASPLWIAPDGSDGGGLGTESMPFRTVDAAVAVADPRGHDILAKPGEYGASNITAQGVRLRAADPSRQPIIYGGGALVGGVAFTGLWANHSGNVWKLTDADDPLAMVLRQRSDGRFFKGIRKDSVGELTTERFFFYDSGPRVLYLYTGGGAPGATYDRVHRTATTGTASIYTVPASGIFPFGLLYVGPAANDVLIQNVRVIGGLGNGILGDDALRLCIEGGETSYNQEDGRGGFGLVGYVSRAGKSNFNGFRRLRLYDLSDITTQGDGDSLHLGAAQSTFAIEDMEYEGNDKDGIQNIHGSTGTIDRVRIKDCALNLVFNGSGNQTARNVEIVMGSDNLGGIGFLTSAVITLENVTIRGQAVAGVPALRMIQGSASLANAIVSNLAVGVADDYGIGVLAEDYNCWHAIGAQKTVGGVGSAMSLGAHDLTSDPLFYDASAGDLRLQASSPCAAAGTDLSSTSPAVDVLGRARRASAWSMGARQVAAPALSGAGARRDRWR